MTISLHLWRVFPLFVNCLASVLPYTDESTLSSSWRSIFILANKANLFRSGAILNHLPYQLSNTHSVYLVEIDNKVYRLFLLVTRALDPERGSLSYSMYVYIYIYREGWKKQARPLVLSGRDSRVWSACSSFLLLAACPVLWALDVGLLPL